MSDKAENLRIKPVCPSWHRSFITRINGSQQRQRLPHAILLSLPGESDELAFLWYLSMSLLCRDNDAGQPCGQCPTCHLMLANTYPDFKVVGLLYDDKKKKTNKNIKDKSRYVI